MSTSQNPFSHRNTGGRLSSNSSASSSSNRGGPFHSHAPWGTPVELDQPFTPEMRDRQARGKDPYSAGDDISDASDAASPGRMMMGGGGRGGGGGGHGGDHHTSSRNSNSSGKHQQQQQQQQQQQPKEPFSKVERRDWAETVLDNPELLMMYSQSSGDTLPATRYKFKKIMCGFEDEEEDDESIPDTRGGGNYHQHQQYQVQQQHSTVQQQRGRGGGGGEPRR